MVQTLTSMLSGVQASTTSRGVGISTYIVGSAGCDGCDGFCDGCDSPCNDSPSCYDSDCYSS